MICALTRSCRFVEGAGHHLEIGRRKMQDLEKLTESLKAEKEEAEVTAAQVCLD